MLATQEFDRSLRKVFCLGLCLGSHNLFDPDHGESDKGHQNQNIDQAIRLVGWGLSRLQ